MTQGDLEAAFIYSQLTNSNSILNQLATEKKYPPAQFLLGSQLFKTDQPRAVELIRKAADGGLASACFQMARFYANGVLEKNLERSVHYAKVASKKCIYTIRDYFNFFCGRSFGSIVFTWRVLYTRRGYRKGFGQGNEMLYGCC